MAINESRNSALYKLQDFGKFQIVQYCLICLPLVFVSMTHVNYVFVAEDVDHRCLVPECESENPSIEKPDWWPEDIDTKCSRPILNTEKYNLFNKTCNNETVFDAVGSCNKWVYENNHSMFDLGCQSWKATLVGSVHNAGMIVSMIVTGWIADKIGRKPTIIMCSVGGCIGVIKIFLGNYYAYLAVEFLESVMASGLYTAGVVLSKTKLCVFFMGIGYVYNLANLFVIMKVVIEVGGDSKRVLTGVIFSYSIYCGEVTFAFIALGLNYWKSIIIVVYSPLMLFIVYIIILRESSRWQILRGKITEAKETLKLVAKLNKIDITAEEVDNTDPKELRTKFNIEEQNEKESIKEICNSKEILKRLAVASFCFFTSSFLYYGSIVHAVLLPGNKYTNFVWASLTSFPGDLIAYFTFKKFGRRITLQYGYMLSAVFLIAQNYAPESMTRFKLVLFLIGKLGVVICFTGMYTYSLELFPTSVRGSLLGLGNTAARVGSMLAPLTPLLMTKLIILPSILFSSTATISAILLTLTPETKTLPMFDTIAQMEAYSRNINVAL